MSIDCYRPQSVVTGNGHSRWTDFSIYCGSQWSEMDTLHNLLSLAIYIDRFPPPFLATAVVYPQCSPSSTVAGSYLSIDFPLVSRRWQYISTDFTPAYLRWRYLSITFALVYWRWQYLSIDFSPRLLTLAIDHCVCCCPGCVQDVQVKRRHSVLGCSSDFILIFDSRVSRRIGRRC